MMGNATTPDSVCVPTGVLAAPLSIQLPVFQCNGLGKQHKTVQVSGPLPNMLKLLAPGFCMGKSWPLQPPKECR